VKIVYLAIIDVTAEAAQTRHVFEVCENWIMLGHQVTLFVPDVPENPSQILCTKVVKVKTFGLKPGFFLTLVYNLAVVLYLLRHKILNGIDVVYTRNSAFEFVPIVCLKIFGVRYIAEINGLDSEQKRLYGLPEWKIRVSEWLNGICYALSDAIIVVTEQIRDFLVHRYPSAREKIHVVPNGANVEISVPIPKDTACERLALDIDHTYLVFVGTLKKWHGVENAIAAVEKLIECDDNWALLIVGDGPEKNYLQNMTIRKGLDERIMFMGKVKYDEVPFYIGAASVCLAPFDKARNDLTGLSPLKIFEYMACGKPIITTRVGGLERIIDQHECGMVVDPENVDGLVKAITKLLSEPELAEKLGKRGRRAAVEHYTWRKIGDRIIEIINSVD